MSTINKKQLYIISMVLVTIGMLVIKGLATVVNKTAVFMLGVG